MPAILASALSIPTSLMALAAYYLTQAKVLANPATVSLSDERGVA